MGITDSYVWQFLIAINLIFAITITFLERRNVSASWAWLMVLSFFPIGGFILYIVLGQNLSKRKIFTWDKRGYDYLEQRIAEQKEHMKNMEEPFNTSITQRYKDLILMNMKTDHAVYTNDNEVEIFTDGKEKFNALFQDIASAKKHIHVLYYIIQNDTYGNRLLDALIEKAKEGVEIRLIYDDAGSRRISKKRIKKLREAGGNAEAFFPGKLPLINLRINFRNHRKLVIIDRKVGYLGGFNVGEEYLGLDPKFGYWRDTHLRIIGDAVNDLQSRFMLDWAQASGDKMEWTEDYFKYSKQHNEKGVGLQIVTSGPDSEREQIKKSYIRMILDAKEYIYLQTPYFIPDDSLLDAIRIASMSGVDVRVMIPNKPDHLFVYWATYSYVGELLKAGAKVFLYENGFLHAKTMVIDDRLATVGTANIDVRSFRLNFEVNAIIYHADTAVRLRDTFADDLKQSHELTSEIYNNRSLLIRFKESLSRLLSPVL
ncbi:cardiolipin synthase [Pradoshia sp. D12]|uniref:cardiolipin synthase n=1 Tax=Bacillaceae TaxID=186817 RepID=UPI00080AE3C2|nr:MULTISPECIES: cardiolipin synthase [Bacillaceae]OCA82512.1 cardiolipin synthase [Bacillus sp. FJAT-27986]QFK70282.1 cardiolipin synthase [Pradoshia sp. D12]TPF71062.1 cardiolipin synthase [Bacillus sp. D12]